MGDVTRDRYNVRVDKALKAAEKVNRTRGQSVLHFHPCARLPKADDQVSRNREEVMDIGVLKSMVEL